MCYLSARFAEPRRRASITRLRRPCSIAAAACAALRSSRRCASLACSRAPRRRAPQDPQDPACAAKMSSATPADERRGSKKRCKRPRPLRPAPSQKVSLAETARRRRLVGRDAEAIQKQMQQMLDMYLGAGIIMTRINSWKWPSKARANPRDCPDADPFAGRRV